MLATDSNTLCITDIEQWKLVTVGEVWVVAASFVLWTEKSEFMKYIWWKTHIASALGGRGRTTELGRGNDTAKRLGTFFFGDDCEVHIV